MVIESPAKMKRASSDSDSEDLLDDRSRSPITGSGVDRKKRRGIIEKRRRDRINNSLGELKRLVPSAYEKQGSAKLEKAEILQMTVDHLKTLQQKGLNSYTYDQTMAADLRSVGFRECAAEVARYLASMEGLDPHDPLRLRLLSHLQCCSHHRDAETKTRLVAAAASTPCHPHHTWTNPGSYVGGPASGPNFHSGSAGTVSPAEHSIFPPPSGPGGMSGPLGGPPGGVSGAAGGQSAGFAGMTGCHVAVSTSCSAAGAAASAASSADALAASSFRFTGSNFCAPAGPATQMQNHLTSSLLPSHAFSSISLGAAGSGIGHSSYPVHPSQGHPGQQKPYRPWGTELGAY